MLSAKERIAGAILPVLLLAIPAIVSAQILKIHPALVDASHNVEQALMTHKGHASTAVTGRGGSLVITYQSTEPLEIFMVPLSPSETFIPTDFIRFTLPQTELGTVEIDLTVSPGWSPAEKTWNIHLLSTDENAGAGFADIHFEPQSALNVPVTAIRHFFTKEIYTPSSYHALRGYRVLGTSLSMVLGVLVLLAVGVCLLMFGNTRRKSAVLAALIIAPLLYQARFSIDLLRFTGEHLTGYAEGNYDEAGSIYSVASVIRGLRADSTKPLSVYVCRDGTNFKEKLLRYFAYPVRVSAEKTMAEAANYALVMDKFKWGYQTTVSKDSTNMKLLCGDLDRQAEKVTEFPDGDVLFRLLPSPGPS